MLFVDRHVVSPTPLGVVLRTLGIITAALLAIDAYVHFTDAHLYDTQAGGAITQGNLFRVQASVAIVVALAVLVRPTWPSWVAAVLVAASAVGAVYLYRYVDVGSLGPLPNMYEPTWALSGKRLSAIVEGAATITALAGFAVALSIREPTHSAQRDRQKSHT